MDEPNQRRHLNMCPNKSLRCLRRNVWTQIACGRLRLCLRQPRFCHCHPMSGSTQVLLKQGLRRRRPALDPFTALHQDLLWKQTHHIKIHRGRPAALPLGCVLFLADEAGGEGKLPCSVGCCAKPDRAHQSSVISALGLRLCRHDSAIATLTC